MFLSSLRAESGSSCNGRFLSEITDCTYHSDQNRDVVCPYDSEQALSSLGRSGVDASIVVKHVRWSSLAVQSHRRSRRGGRPRLGPTRTGDVDVAGTRHLEVQGGHSSTYIKRAQPYLGQGGELCAKSSSHVNRQANIHARHNRGHPRLYALAKHIPRGGNRTHINVRLSCIPDTISCKTT
jgi:hypothetical protein